MSPLSMINRAGGTQGLARRVAFCTVLLLSQGAAAQAASAAAPEPSGYREAIETAIEEYQLNHFTEAREHFVRAHALFPNARSLRGLGITDFELRHYVASVSYLEQALAAQARPLEGALRKETMVLLERAKGYVGELTLNVEPAGAVVALDGLTRERDSSGSLKLDVGDHVLEVRASGRVTERRALEIHGGRNEALHIRLTPLGEGQASATEAPRPDHDDSGSARVPLYRRWWLWTLVSVVVVGAAAGTAVALTRDVPTHEEPRTTDNTPPGVELQPLGWR